jgi:hypothetical protein
MSKRVVDLSPEELEQLAAGAWDAAARQALSRGHAVTGSRGGRRLRVHPDGRIEDIGPVESPNADDSRSLQKTRSRQTVA